MSRQSSIQVLAELLHDHARPVIRPQRLAPSTLYDLDYRMAVIAITFHMHSGEGRDDTRRIDFFRLKLLQFFAQRPMLVPMVAQWASSMKDGKLLGAKQRLKRGYMGDSTYDRVVDYMVARGILGREGKYLVVGPNGAFIDNINELAEKETMFASEKHALGDLRAIRITNAMLEGL